jgi:hypothetical protein
MIGLEEAYRAAGHPPEVALALSASELHLPALAPFKKLGSQLADLAGEYARAGDAQSQERLLEGVWQTGSQLRESGRDGPLITDLVGLALQNITLQRWPENIPAPFLDVPVSTRLEMNQSFRTELRQTSELFGQWLPTAPDHEITSYYQRLRMLGEKEAMNWLKQRNPNFVP